MGQNIHGSAIFSQFRVLFSWLLQIKVGKVASFVGKIFMVQCSTTKTTNITLYTVYIFTIVCVLMQGGRMCASACVRVLSAQ